MGWRDWTGVGERRWKTAPNEQVQPSKTLWDLLQLLIVPVILVGVSLWWSASQDSRDKSRADQVRQDTTLNDYIQQMSDLMLNKRLPSSKRDDAVRSVARTVTLTALRRLDGGRKGEVVRFLQEAGSSHEAMLGQSRWSTCRALTSRPPTSRAPSLTAPTSRAPTSGRRPPPLGADLTRADLTRRRPHGRQPRPPTSGRRPHGRQPRGADLTAPTSLAPTSRAPTSRRRPRGRRPHGRHPHGRRPHGRRPHGRRPHGRRPHGRRPHARRPFGCQGASVEKPLLRRRGQHEFGSARRSAGPTVAELPE